MEQCPEMSSPFKTIAEANDMLANLLKEKGVILPFSSGNDQFDNLELNRLAVMLIARSKSIIKGIPEGNWYMVTLTTPDTAGEQECLEIFEKAKEYFIYHKATVQHAVLEKSNIWHVHMLVNLPSYNKNSQRDLSKACKGYRVQIEKRITTLHSWNGCMYYFEKDNHTKSDTKVRTLIDGIEKVAGKGYILK